MGITDKRCALKNTEMRLNTPEKRPALGSGAWHLSALIRKRRQAWGWNRSPPKKRKRTENTCLRTVIAPVT